MALRPRCRSIIVRKWVALELRVKTTDVHPDISVKIYAGSNPVKQWIWIYVPGTYQRP